MVLIPNIINFKRSVFMCMVIVHIKQTFNKSNEVFMEDHMEAKGTCEFRFT